MFFDVEVAKATRDDESFARALRYFGDLVLAGGKRVRGTLIVEGYIAAGGEKSDAILRAAAGMEILHAMILMQDDIIDRDDLRHGVMTMHAYYACADGEFSYRKDREHFGRSMGIMLGDYLYGIGTTLMMHDDFDPRANLRGLRELHEVISQTVIGEFQDVVMEESDGVTQEQVLAMYARKTAHYTIDGPLKVGAILAGADKEFCTTLESFTMPLGIAFQLQDDFLGVYGDTHITGKSVGSDIAEGKNTVLVLRAYEQASQDQKNVLDTMLGNQNLTEDHVKEFQDILDETGARDSVRAQMNDLFRTSREALEKQVLPNHFQEFFRGLITYLERRDQ